MPCIRSTKAGERDRAIQSRSCDTIAYVPMFISPTMFIFTRRKHVFSYIRVHEYARVERRWENTKIQPPLYIPGTVPGIFFVQIIRHPAQEQNGRTTVIFFLAASSKHFHISQQTAVVVVLSFASKKTPATRESGICKGPTFSAHHQCPLLTLRGRY